MSGAMHGHLGSGAALHQPTGPLTVLTALPLSGKGREEEHMLPCSWGGQKLPDKERAAPEFVQGPG